MASSTDSDSDYADFSSDDEAATASHVDVEPANPPSLSRQITGQMCPSDVTSIMQLASRLLMKAAVASVFVNTCTAQKVDHVHSILSIPKEECRLFLEFLRWDDELVQAKFLDSEAELRKSAGVTAGACPPSPPAGQPFLEECPCTLDDEVPWEQADALPCGHWMSKVGWREHMAESASRGPSMVLTRCFASGCNERVRSRMFKEYLSPAEFKRYTAYALAAFIQGDRHLVQCVGADCDQVVHVAALQPHDLQCSKCKTVFCSSCGAEGHQPSTCSQLRAWVKKNTDEGENITWIHANTKPCPKCHVNIEKNQGCNHMTCRRGTGGCGHQFCWLCLGDYKNHSQCKPPQSLVATQEKAAMLLDRFMAHFTPYHNHDTARKHARKMKLRLKRQHFELVQFKFVPLRDADVLLQAVDAVLDGRRVLMHTHVFAYYCDDKSELALFEHMQEQLSLNNERVLERLELRTEVDDYLAMDDPEQKRVELLAFITELRNYTELSLKFMHEMLRAVQGGLLDDSGSAGGAGGGSSTQGKPKRSKPWQGSSAAGAAAAVSGASLAALQQAEGERELQVAQLMSVGHERSNAEAALRATFGDLAAAEALLV